MEFRGKLQVTITHPETDQPSVTRDHDTLHRDGEFDIVELQITGTQWVDLPWNKCVYGEVVEVTRNKAGLLVIKEQSIAHPSQRFFQDRSSTEWFDILVGYELKMMRLRVAADACQAQRREPQDNMRVHLVRIPAAAMDRMCDLIRAHEEVHAERRHLL